MTSKFFTLLATACIFCCIAASAQIINTIAGNGTGTFGGDGGPATSASLFQPYDMAFDAAGNLFITDYENHRIRKVNTTGIISTYAGDGTLAFGGDGGQATAAHLGYCPGIAIDGSGNLYISDNLTNRIRRISASGIISTIAGTGFPGYTGDGGPATAAQIFNPYGIAVGSSGTIYFAEFLNHRIRKIDASGVITTIAGSGPTGTGMGGFAGDGGPATDARLDEPCYVALDAAGNIYFSDSHNYRVRKINTAGIISTVAGTGTFGAAGDGGPASVAQLGSPYGVKVDGSGNLYIGENYKVRKVNTAGVITTIAGTGSGGFSGDGGPATAATIQGPMGIAHSPAGGIQIADFGNNRIRSIMSGTTAEDQINNASGEISIVPNPGTGRFNVSGILPTAFGGNVMLVVTDVSGKAVYENTTTILNEQINAIIDISRAPKGVYVLQLRCGAAGSISRALIKN